MRNKAFYLLLSLILVLTAACSKDSAESPDPHKNDLSKGDIEQKLQDACGNNAEDINSLVSTLKTNENVEEVFASKDNMQVIVKYKGEDHYSVFPVHQPIDPFDETLSNSNALPSSVIRRMPSKIDYNYKTTGTNGKVAVFNYFSNNHYGDDRLGSRTTQNMLIDYMCQELNQNNYGVEYYGYEKMTLDNLLKIKNNKADYKAVVIISHGFADNGQSYFVIGEEYNELKAISTDFYKNEGFEEPFKYQFWNEGLSAFGDRYDFVVPVKLMDFGDNTLLYMGSCDAYRYESDMKGKCIGWDGTNSCAQAHVALLFHKLMRGKTLYDALDIDDSQYNFYNRTNEQVDTWKNDLIYEDTHMRTSMATETSAGVVYVGGGLAKKHWAKDPNYYESGSTMPMMMVYDASGKINEEMSNNKNGLITRGICAMKDHKFTLKFHSPDLSLLPEYVYIKATPLRADEKPIVKKVKTSRLNKGFKIELEANGVYDISAGVDEGFYSEILLFKQVVFVYAKPFKANSIPLGDDEEDEEDDPAVEAGLCPDNDHPHIIDMGERGKWACCNVGASAPWEFGGYYSWGETEEKDDYNWDYYTYCNGTKETCQYLGDDISGSNYDVAHVKWKGSWKMPNRDEFLSLIGCSEEYTTLNGIRGMIFLASNGNSIFLPAAGYPWFDEEDHAYGMAYYWSSNQNQWDSFLADGLCFKISGRIFLDSDERYIGRSVRPISK